MYDICHILLIRTCYLWLAFSKIKPSSSSLVIFVLGLYFKDFKWGSMLQWSVRLSWGYFMSVKFQWEVSAQLFNFQDLFKLHLKHLWTDVSQSI